MNTIVVSGTCSNGSVFCLRLTPQDAALLRRDLETALKETALTPSETEE